MAALPDNNPRPIPIPPPVDRTSLSVDLLLAGTGWVLVMTLMDLLLVGVAPLLLALRLAGLALPVWWWLDRRPCAWVAAFWLAELALGQVLAIYTWADEGAPPVALAAGALCGFLLMPAAAAGGFRWRPVEKGSATGVAAPFPPAVISVPLAVLRLSMEGLQARLQALSASLERFATRQTDPAQATELRDLRTGLDATAEQVRQMLGLEPPTISPPPGPINPPSSRPRAPAKPAERGARHPLSVLLVDDDAVGRTLMRLLLERDGHEVEETDDAKMALEMALMEGPQVAFISARIGRHRGLALAHCIRTGGGPPVWLLQGPADMVSDRQRERAGLQGILTKPITPATLTAALDRVSDPSAAPAPPMVPARPSAPLAADLLNLSVLEEHLELLGRARVNHIIDSFLTTAPETLALAASAAQARDLVELGRAAHKLAGGSLTVGAAALAVQARKLEAAARAEDVETALAVAADLSATFQEAAAAFARFRRARLDQAGG